MVKHIVLFKLKPFNSESERLAACEKIKSELSALVEKVPTLLTAEVGINCNPNEQFDIALTTTHNDMEGLKEEILKSVQDLFQSDFIYKVAISGVKFG